jgi:hypothetical protein
MSEEEKTSVRGSFIDRLDYSPAASLMSLAESTVERHRCQCVFERGRRE